MQAETPNDMITIVSEFPSRNPNSLFDFWTKPKLLEKWWPPEAEVEPRLNGSYSFFWPKQDWNLHGVYTQFERGNVLGLTRKLYHEPNNATHVEMKFESISDGTRLTHA
ncbi:MAG: SRPBCC family protein [Nitrososphaerales archaeon]